MVISRQLRNLVRACSSIEDITNTFARIFLYSPFIGHIYTLAEQKTFFVTPGQVRSNFLREFPQQKLVVNNVSGGFSGLIPEGHIHFLQNFGCEPAQTLSFFDTSDQGLIDITPAL